MKKFLLYSGSFIIFQIIIVVLALFKPTRIIMPFVSGNIVHFIAVFFSVILLYLTLTHEFLLIQRPILIVIMYGIIISLSGEFIQLFFSYRTFDYQDIIMGVIAALSAGTLIFIKKNK